MESLNIAMTSANINMWTLGYISFINNQLQPSIFQDFTSSLMYKMNKNGLNMHPCLMPISHLKYSESPSGVLIQDLS